MSGQLPAHFELLDTDEIDTKFNTRGGTVVHEAPRRMRTMQKPVGDGWSRKSGDNPVISGNYADPEVIVLPEKSDPVWVAYENLGASSGEDIEIRSTTDGVSFSSPTTALGGSTGGHFAFPSMFREGDTIYMTPDTAVTDIDLYKTTVSDFPTGWSNVWTQQATLSGTAGDPRIVPYDGTYYLFYDRKNDQTNDWHITVAALEDVEDTATLMHVGHIYPSDPNSDTTSDESPYITVLGDEIILHYSNSEAAQGMHGAILSGLSLDGFSLKRFEDNPVLSAGSSGNWDDNQVHALSVIDGAAVGDPTNWWGYYDGHNGSQWNGIGVVTLSKET